MGCWVLLLLSPCEAQQAEGWTATTPLVGKRKSDAGASLRDGRSWPVWVGASRVLVRSCPRSSPSHVFGLGGLLLLPAGFACLPGRCSTEGGSWATLAG